MQIAENAHIKRKYIKLYVLFDKLEKKQGPTI